MEHRQFLTADAGYTALDDFFSMLGARKLMLVHGRSMNRLKLGEYFKKLAAWIEVIEFMDFTPNPEYESIERGVEIFNREHCDAIAAVGGGSAIDNAKCIKLFSNMNPNTNYIEQKIVPNNIPFLAAPTTGGSGSEATQFAVIYYRDKKYSIDDASALPDAVFFDANVLLELPVYQKKATLLDAFCHAVESTWSVNANDESRHYAREAVRLITANKNFYIDGKPDLQCCTFVMYAANLAGRAINISKTTAGHAMCYSLTKKFGLAHGHAVARCLVPLWKFMLDFAIEHERAELLRIFDDLAAAMNCATTGEAIEAFDRQLDAWQLNQSIEVAAALDELTTSVNLQRLANNPVELRADVIKELYRQIGR